MNDKPFGIIYKATNTVNNKVYIGQTMAKLSVRKSKHIYDSKNGSNIYFHLALRKYKLENFLWEVICDCTSIDECNERERYFISHYQSANREKGYNLDLGGKNSERSEETKNKIKLSKQNISEETKNKIRKANVGKKTKNKIRVANLGKKLSDETVEKIKSNNNRYWKDKKLSAESIAKRTLKRKKRIVCNETNEIFESIKEASEKLKISHISEHLKGRVRKIKNYTFRYYEN
jgi:group I intron endonuclease